MNAHILDLQGYDLILGRDFLRSFNPILDWANSTMTLRNGGKSYTVRALVQISWLPKSTEP